MTQIPARLSIVTLGTRHMSALRSFYRGAGMAGVDQQR